MPNAVSQERSWADFTPQKYYELVLDDSVDASDCQIALSAFYKSSQPRGEALYLLAELFINGKIGLRGPNDAEIIYAANSPDAYRVALPLLEQSAHLQYSPAIERLAALHKNGIIKKAEVSNPDRSSATTPPPEGMAGLAIILALPLIVASVVGIVFGLHGKITVYYGKKDSNVTATSLTIAIISIPFYFHYPWLGVILILTALLLFAKSVKSSCIGNDGVSKVVLSVCAKFGALIVLVICGLIVACAAQNAKDSIAKNDKKQAAKNLAATAGGLAGYALTRKLINALVASPNQKR